VILDGVVPAVAVKGEGCEGCCGSENVSSGVVSECEISIELHLGGEIRGSLMQSGDCGVTGAITLFDVVGATS